MKRVVNCPAAPRPSRELSSPLDDGYRSAYTVAFPVLQKYHLPATIYLTVDSVETGQVAWYDRIFLAMAVAPSGELQLDLRGPWRFQLNSPEDRLRAALEVVALLRTLPNAQRRVCCALLENKIGLPQNALSSRVLTWEEIHAMHQAGIAFGSHTLTHPVVSQLTPQELEQELGASKCLLEKKIGNPRFGFCFSLRQGLRLQLGSPRNAFALWVSFRRNHRPRRKYSSSQSVRTSALAGRI